MAKPAQEPTAAFRRRIITATTIVIALIVLLYFLWQAVYVLLLVFSGVLIAILLRSAAVGIANLMRIPVRGGLAVAIMLLFGAIVLLIWLGAPAMSDQFEQLADRLPSSIESLKSRMMQYKWGGWAVNAMPTTQSVQQSVANFVWGAAGFLSGAMNIVVGAIVVIFVGIYMAAEPELYTNGILRLVPHGYRAKGAEILGSIRYTLQWWLIGQAITMVIIGVLTGLGLWWIGIPLWFLLGLLAALFNFIPNFGPFVSYVPAVLLALAISPTKAYWVTALFIAAQSFEGYILTPLIQRRAVLLPPALTLSAQVLLGVTVGALGVMVAAPLTAAVLVLVKMLYVEEALGDDIETPADHLKRSDLPPLPKSSQESR